MRFPTGRLWVCGHCKVVAAEEIVVKDGDKTDIRWFDPNGKEVVRPSECRVCHSILLPKDKAS